MRVLVCGGRDYPADAVWHWLSNYASSEIGGNITVLLHGGATGADSAAGEWARRSSCGEVREIAYPSNWRKYGKRAGPLRNQRMIDEGKPDVVVAFAGGRGTADMIRRAEAACIRVVRA